MKESKFNVFFKDEDDSEFVLFNSQTTALCIINPIEMNTFKNLKSKGFQMHNNHVEKDFISELQKGGFLIDDNSNEIETLKYLQKVSQFSTDSLSLTIAPTMGCNFGCKYCYQGDHNSFSKMSLEIQNQLINYVKNRMPKISSLDVTWYGGEPLLAMDIIEHLSLEFLQLCSENNVTYNASIITNGYYLTKDIASKFNSLKINFAQVTLDGDKEYHDNKRTLKNGSGTFDKIISNLIDIKEVFHNISIRINTDIYNKDHVVEIIDILKRNDLLDIAVPYLGYIEPTNDFYESNNCLSPEEFSNINNNFFNELSKNITIDLMDLYPHPKLNSCLADSNTGYVIDPLGNIFKCWCDIGFDEYSVGNINTGVKKYDRIIDYFNYNVFADDNCRNCNISPLCLGGCPRKRVDNKENHCDIIKYSLKEKLSNIVKFKNIEIKSLEFYSAK